MPQECVSASRRAGKAIAGRAHTTGQPLRPGFCALSNFLDNCGCRKIVLAHAREQACQPVLQPAVEPAQLQRLRIVERSLAPHIEQRRPEVCLNGMQIRQLRPADLAGLRDVVAHPAGEFHALLLELVQQFLHPLRLPGDIGTTHPPGIGIDVEQAQFLHLRGLRPGIYDAGRLRKSRILLGQQRQGGKSPVAGYDGVAVLCLAHPQGIHQAA